MQILSLSPDLLRQNLQRWSPSTNVLTSPPRNSTLSNLRNCAMVNTTGRRLPSPCQLMRLLEPPSSQLYLLWTLVFHWAILPEIFWSSLCSHLCEVSSTTDCYGYTKAWTSCLEQDNSSTSKSAQGYTLPAWCHSVAWFHAAQLAIHPLSFSFTPLKPSAAHIIIPKLSEEYTHTDPESENYSLQVSHLLESVKFYWKTVLFSIHWQSASGCFGATETAKYLQEIVEFKKIQGVWRKGCLCLPKIVSKFRWSKTRRQ